MPIPIQIFHDDVRSTLKKANSGFVSPEDIDFAINRACLDLLSTLIMEHELTSNRNIVDQSLLKLFPFTGGVAEIRDLPTDVFKVSSVFIGDYEGDLLSDKEFNDRLHSLIIPPSGTRPIATIYEGKIRINPSNANHVIKYWRNPATCKFAYTSANGVIAYSAGGSVDIDFPISEKSKLFSRTMVYLAPSAKNAEAAQLESILRSTMATTRTKIREEIQLLYGQFLQKNGFNDNIDVRLIDILVSQSINKFLKTQTLQTLKAGSVEIPTCNIITYDLVVSNGVATLPVYPISLPMDMGVWRVYLTSNPNVLFIPINKGYSTVYQGLNVEFLEGQTGYIINGNKLTFKNTVPTSNVSVDLLVSDFTTIGEGELLPVSPEIESTVISDVLEIISQGRFSQSELNSKDTKVNAN